MYTLTTPGLELTRVPGHRGGGLTSWVSLTLWKVVLKNGILTRNLCQLDNFLSYFDTESELSLTPKRVRPNETQIPVNFLNLFLECS